MNKTIFGIDNGITGTIGVINGTMGTQFIKVPIVKQQDYTKKKKNVSRINVDMLKAFFINNTRDSNNTLCLVERPMVNPTRFTATITAVRALESVITILEYMTLPYMYIDSKEWAKLMLPAGCKGSEQLKKASKDIGIRLFPQFKELIAKHGDADGMLIAEYGHRTYS